MKPIIMRAKDLKGNDFNSNEFEKFSIALVKHNSNSRLGLDPESDVAYYILKGKATWIINNKEYLVSKGDLVFLPKGTKYKKKTKNLLMLAISSPRFDRKKRVYF